MSMEEDLIQCRSQTLAKEVERGRMTGEMMEAGARMQVIQREEEEEVTEEDSEVEEAGEDPGAEE